MILNSPYITGSITVTGNANVQGTLTVTGSLSGTATSASLALNSNLLQGTGSVGFATTSSFAATSGSVSSRITQIENVYATTGSNSFRANQSITGSLVVSSTITAQTLVVQTVTSSIVYSSGSNIFGSQLSDRQTFTGSVNITGSVTNYGNLSIVGNLFPNSRVNIGGATDDADIGLNVCAPSGSGKYIMFGRNAARTAVFSLSDAGAGSFSSNVTMGGNTLTSTGPTGFTLKTTTTGAWTAVYGDTGGLYLGTNAGNWMSIMNSGYIGVGSAAPKNIFQITNLTSSGALPAIGAIGNGTSLYLTNNNTGYGMLLGSLPTGDSWIQAQRTDGTATTYNLQLQPNGGTVTTGGSINSTGDIVANAGSSTAITVYNASSIRGKLSMTGNEGDLTLYGSSATAKIYLSAYYDSYFNGGAVFINHPLNIGEGKLRVSQDGSYWNTEIRHTYSTQYFMLFRYNSTGLGSIQGNGSNTSYYTTSDYRLKEDLKEISGLEKVSAIKVYDFKWKSTGERMAGVLAHELSNVLPYAVTGDKDALDKDGNINPQGVDYSKLVPVLTKAIQELKATNDSLQAQINELKER